MKRAIVHDTARLSQRGTRLLFALAAIFGWKVWTEEVRRAYIQATGRSLRDVYITSLNGAENELRLKPHDALRLLRPLYGLAEAGDLWHSEFPSKHKNELGMQELESEPALYAKFCADLICGMTGLYADDTTLSGTNSFAEWTAKKSDYVTQPREVVSGNVLVQQFACDGCTWRIFLTQEQYAQGLQPLQSSIFATYRSRRMEVAWVNHTRPDIAYEVARAAQVTEQ
jgi:Reverse transcriptase (RNA-dependent DNA polymerase)